MWETQMDRSTERNHGQSVSIDRPGCRGGSRDEEGASEALVLLHFGILSWPQQPFYDRPADQSAQSDAGEEVTCCSDLHREVIKWSDALLAELSCSPAHPQSASDQTTRHSKYSAPFLIMIPYECHITHQPQQTHQELQKTHISIHTEITDEKQAACNKKI